MASKHERLRIEAHRQLDMLLQGRLVHTIYVAGNPNTLNLGSLERIIKDAYNSRPVEAPPEIVTVRGKQYRLEDIQKLDEVL